MMMEGRDVDRIVRDHKLGNVWHNSRCCVFSASDSNGQRSRSPVASRVPSNDHEGRFDFLENDLNLTQEQSSG